MISTEKIIFQRTRDFGQKLNATIEFIKQNFKPLIGAIFRVVGIPMLFMAFIWGGLYFTGLTYLVDGDFEPAIVTLMAFGLILALALGVLYQALFYGTIYEYILLYIKNDLGGFTTSDVAQEVKRNLGSHVVTVLALAGMIFVIIIPIGVIAFLFQDSPGLIVLFMFAFFIFIFYLFVCLTLFVVIRIHEKIPVTEAVSRSFKLIKGKWWSTFGLIFVCSLIQSFASYLVLIPYYVVVFFFGISGEFDMTTAGTPDAPVGIIVATVVFYTLYMLMALILSLLTYIAVAFQYYNLVEMKEATGLMNRIDTFGQTTQEDEGHY